MTNPTSYSWSLTGDVVAPVVYSASSQNGTTVIVIFSEPVVSSEALVAENYTFDGGLTSVSVGQVSETAYQVTTTAQTPGTSYTVTVSNVHDLNGNLI